MDEDRRRTKDAPDAGAQLEGYLSVKARIISVLILVLVLLTIWYMLDLVLLTFVMMFIFYNLLVSVHRLTKDRLRKRVPDGAILLVLYIVIFALLSAASGYFAPKLVTQITEIAEIFRNFDFDNVRESLDPAVADIFSSFDLDPYISGAGSMLLSWLGRFGSFSINILLAILLSFMLLLEKGKLAKFGEVLGRSRISFLYRYTMNFGGNFVRSFATVMKVQVQIALINCILSIILLSILGFPQVLGLGIMIFTLGLIPVAGVIISLLPLSIVAFNTGGIPKVIAVIIMIVVIHGIEAYILNPKLMSNKTSLPVSFVFIILVVAEHYLGVWGLLIGVPLFIFLLNIFEVDYASAFPQEGPLLRRFARWASKVGRARAAGRRGAEK
ncbi:MAG: AI-2E family transporter [Clostridiales Family XIII bacterium]|jgi:predicted PurR-regulated permease PerM|nr:AI-2E family transporter [Clostridiales Family XIII bacterium]